MSDSPVAATELNYGTGSGGSGAEHPFSRATLLSAWLPVVVCVLAIAAESTPYFGADHTSSPLRRFFELFHGPFTGPEWWRFHHYVRKCGHFIGYGILSASWFRAFWMTYRPFRSLSERRFSSHGLAMLGTLLVASSDEFHQSFLPNRTSSVWDVLIDCCGGAAMQLLILMWMRSRIVG